VRVNIDTGTAQRFLHDHPSTQAEATPLQIEGKAWLQGGAVPQVASDGIAIDPAGGWLYYHPLSGRGLFRVPLTALDAGTGDVAAQVQHLADTGGTDGMIFRDGAVYLTALERDGIQRWTEKGGLEEVLTDPRLAWPDTFALGPDGTLYVTAAQIHRTSPVLPYRLFKVNHLP